MKKLLGSILVVSLISSLSISALEKPGYPNVDYETFKIEKLRGENPEVRSNLAKLKLLKKRAQRETGQKLEQIKAEIKKVEKMLGSSYK